jgi:hypothetical protein
VQSFSIFGHAFNARQQLSAKLRNQREKLTAHRLRSHPLFHCRTPPPGSPGAGESKRPRTPASPCPGNCPVVYRLTTAYRPAQEVGGDFFQIIPLDGSSTLVVLGDVNGKGLKAAMAPIVGAISSSAENLASPAEILAALNRRLHGRLNGGFASCLALRLDPEDDCVIASAGHPAPFLNGSEIPLRGALPLGLMPTATYKESAIRLHPDHLSLYTPTDY